MITIIGYEGAIGASSVAFGAAVLKTNDGNLVNSLSRLHVRSDPDDGNSITRFRTSWTIDNVEDTSKPIVVALRRLPADCLWPLVPESGFVGYLSKKREQPWTYYLLRTQASFQAYAKEACAQCANAILDEDVVDDDIKILLKCALTLQPADPTLLALRVHFLPNSQRVRRSAERLLERADDNARLKFNEMVTALERASTLLD